MGFRVEYSFESKVIIGIVIEATQNFKLSEALYFDSNFPSKTISYLFLELLELNKNSYSFHD